ncbi:hypothetical protein PHMEG_0005222 [Phytophthora megakarya]|uniref:Uncharacterized protein n=1 Tax=Phytophthora megakarya TaxID=4795 RepID=A0A225WRV5_9STRA|nr:hypothetical protein PHMEG_0005222 [Phytophthora megakarya]
MSIPQPISEVIRPPKLSSWEHAALIEWHPTVKGSVHPKTLKNMATYLPKKPVASMTTATS